MPVPETITKAELLSAMQAGWDALWAVLDTLSEAQLTQLADLGGWTIKDHVIHLAAWEGSMNDVLEQRPRWEALHVSLPTWQTGDFEPINAEIYAYNKDLTWAQVKQTFEQAHNELIGRIQSFTEAELQRPYNYFQPSSDQTHPIAMRLGIASYDHYAKHIPWIKTLAESSDPTMSEQNVTTKAELLAAIDREWRKFNAYLDTLSEAQLTQPTDPAGWTAKDHVAHLYVWEDGMNAFLQKQPRPEYMGIDAETWAGGDFDKINAIIQQRYKDLSWADVRQRFQESHQRLLQQLQPLTDEDLQRPYNFYQPASAATDPAINRLSGNTFHHYAEHQPWIEAIVSRPKLITTKAEALEAMRTGWNEFNAYLDTLSEAQLTQPTDAAGWTAKDHIIHLAVWEDGVNAVFAGENQMRGMGVDDPEAWDKGDWDKLNALIYAQNKNLSLTEVRQRFQQIHERLLATVQSLSDENLQRPYNSYQPNSDYTGPVINTLVGNTSHHYAEHQPWIDAIVKSSK